MSNVAPSLFAALRDEIHGASFSPQTDSVNRVGAEVEFLVFDDASRLPLPLRGRGGLIGTLRQLAPRVGWTEFAGYDGTPRFDVAGQGTISFEPGGQLEISTVPCPSASALVRVLHGIVEPLQSLLGNEGATLLAAGIDPATRLYDLHKRPHFVLPDGEPIDGVFA